MFLRTLPDQVSSAIAQSVWIILQSPVPLTLIKFSNTRIENLFTNTVELATKITKSTNIPELKNYKFWLVDISISIHLDGISHQKYTFTTSSAIDFFYNDNFHTLGKYAVQIDTNGNITLTGEAVQNGYIKVSIYGIY